MNVSEALNNRRAYRVLDKYDITPAMINELAMAASLAPSCYNNQPWRFVFATDESVLSRMNDVYARGNEWAADGSMVIAVVTKDDLDCIIGDRKYAEFDTGLSVGLMMLRAMELGIDTHPIAGYSPEKARDVLGIPEEYKVLTLIVCGKRAKPDGRRDDVIEAESQRPPRKTVEEFAHINRWKD